MIKGIEKLILLGLRLFPIPLDMAFWDLEGF